MYRRGLLARLSAALPRLELAGHVAGGPGGRAPGVSTSGNVFDTSALGGGLNPDRRPELQPWCPVVLCLCACIVAHEEHVVHVRECHGAVGTPTERYV